MKVTWKEISELLFVVLFHTAEGSEETDTSLPASFIAECLKYFLLHLDYYDRTLSIGWLVNNRKLFLTALKAGKCKVKVPADLVSGEGLFLGSRIAAFSL